MKTAMQKLLQRWRRGGGVEAWSLSMAAVGDGSVTHEAQSGRGPGKGFLADTAVQCEVEDYALLLPTDSPLREARNRAVLHTIYRAGWKATGQRYIAADE